MDAILFFAVFCSLVGGIVGAGEIIENLRKKKKLRRCKQRVLNWCTRTKQILEANNRRELTFQEMNDFVAAYHFAYKYDALKNNDIIFLNKELNESVRYAGFLRSQNLIPEFYNRIVRNSL